MGTWGVKIFQNDDASDLREEYRARIILGNTDEEAERAIISEFSMAGGFALWLPLAVTQWELGHMNERAKENALSEIEAELSSLEMLWKPELISKRRKELNAARAQLLSPMPARKKLRMPAWAWKCPWPVGSVLQFRIQYPKEDNPFLGEYVMLQLFGASETPPGKIPCQSINVGLYLWHSKTPPSEQMEKIEAAPPDLTEFIAPNGDLRISRCFMPTCNVRKENEIKCLREVPFVPSGIDPILNNVPSNATFEASIFRTLLARTRD